MTKKQLIKLIFLLVFFINIGCASIVSKKQYYIDITSNPSNCDFKIYNESKKEIYSGKTPDKINLISSDGYFKNITYYLEFKKEGYSNGFEIINSKIDPWYYGNLLYLPFGLLPTIVGGVIIDPLTGSMWELPNSIHTVL